MSDKKKRKQTFQFLRRKFPKNMQKKLVMLFMAIILAFVFLVGRITYINAADGKHYTKVVLDQQQYDSRIIPFKRGDIIDRNGTKMATSERVYNVILDAKVLLSNKKNEEPTKQVLKDCFGIEPSVVDEVIKNSPGSRYNILLKQVTYEQAQAFEKLDANDEEYPFLAGAWLEEDYVRKYPYGALASDVIGFTVSGNVGNVGMENSYNGILNGTDGREYGYLDADASLERTVKEATNGNTIMSTIDVNAQKIVEDHVLAFNEAHKNTARPGEGSANTGVVVMRPNTGEIIAMTNYPNFDLNNPRDISKYYSEEQIAAMPDEEKLNILNSLWKNFCVTDTFEPGSTAKPFTVAGGINSGKIVGDESYYCGGGLQFGATDYVQCHLTSGHGMQTVGEAVANSCNVALMQMGEVIGVEEFSKYQHIFGFGEFTGVDLPGEMDTTGLLYRVDNMKPIDLAICAFGQSFNVTMTQLASGFCSLINGGNYYKPHIVKQIQDQNGNVIETKEPILTKKTISEQTSKQVKEFMRKVVTEGTGKITSVEGYSIGGKTGTAEKLPRGNGKHVLSFIGYAPQDNPEVVVYVVIDEANSDNQANSALVTELSHNIMSDLFPYLNITKTDEAQAAEAQAALEPAEEDAAEDDPSQDEQAAEDQASGEEDTDTNAENE